MPIERLFTTGSLRPQDSMRFVLAGSPDDQPMPALSVPDDWSLEAAESFKESLYAQVPAQHQAVEENTMPSWLWQHRAKGEETTCETTVLEVIDRIAGAATYRGWKLGLWEHEVEASAFYDEAHALLLTRRLILAPQDMARLGLEWAYGIKAPKHASPFTPAQHTAGLILQNDTIDSILRRTQPMARGKWIKFLEDSQTKPTTHISFADTIAQWGSLPKHHDTPQAMLNLLAFRAADGSLDSAALKQATRLAIFMLEIFHDDLAPIVTKDRPLALGFGNLAALLMSLGLAYDSEAGRGTAAALCAIITATATATSAQIAARLGPCAAFSGERERCLRALRNKLRASFGEKNDYDHISILPQTLDITSGADLVLISEARHACEEALRLVQENGLRHMQLTTLFRSPEMMPLMDASSCGVDAETTLTCDYAIGGEQFERRARPALALGLEKLGYEQDDIKAVVAHVAGYHTLIGAPAINHAVLREKGFDDLALRRIEALLPFVDTIRMAFTPWVVGLSFCKSVLGLNEKELPNPQLDLLRHLGFSSQDIAVANAFCCGHRTIKGVSEIKNAHASIFSTHDELDTDAQIRMAAALQSFVTGEVSLSMTVPQTLSGDLRGEMILKAWELGVKSITLHSDTPHLLHPELTGDRPLMRRQTPRLSASHPEATADRISSRVQKPKAPQHTVTLKKGGGKSALRSKRG